jgi:hypothetical protein
MSCFFVRMKGVEPPRREAQDPKSSMSTNSITSANLGLQIYIFLCCKKVSQKNILNRIK